MTLVKDLEHQRAWTNLESEAFINKAFVEFMAWKYSSEQLALLLDEAFNYLDFENTEGLAELWREFEKHYRAQDGGECPNLFLKRWQGPNTKGD